MSWGHELGQAAGGSWVRALGGEPLEAASGGGTGRRYWGATPLASPRSLDGRTWQLRHLSPVLGGPNARLVERPARGELQPLPARADGHPDAWRPRRRCDRAGGIGGSLAAALGRREHLARRTKRV